MPDDLAIALELADLADQITLARFRADDLIVETKPDMTPVSEADRAVEEAIRSRLSTVRPRDGIVGEEFGVEDRGGARRWIVDPIDGTKSYVRGIPVWGTLIALEESGEVVLGVVSSPALRRRWWASRGAGAWLDDGFPGAPRRLSVSRIAELADAHLSVGGLEDWTEAGRLDGVLELSRRCWRTRGYGDVWSYMLVAEGAVEISIDPIVAIWDLAAPMAIVVEAGGRFTDLGGVARPDGGSGVATNGLVHGSVLALLSR